MAAATAVDDNSSGLSPLSLIFLEPLPAGFLPFLFLFGASVLYYTILYYTILYYTILYYAYTVTVLLLLSTLLLRTLTSQSVFLHAI